MAEQYGTTPWGKWFVDVLGTYGIDARLKRGKTYANTGKVLSLAIQDRTITAKVRGQSRPFYTVTIVFPTLNKNDKLFELIEADPLLLSRIQAGELPMELLELLRAQNISLIPKHWGDMQRSCTCPDWGDPCKHMAAVYYILARQIDADPHVLFQLRGVDLAARYGESMTHELEPPVHLIFDEPGISPRLIPSEDPAPFPGTHYGGFIQSLLATKPAFSDRDFSVTLLGFYHQAIRKPLEGIDEEEPLEHGLSHARWSLSAPSLDPGGKFNLHYSLSSGR